CRDPRRRNPAHRQHHRSRRRPAAISLTFHPPQPFGAAFRLRHEPTHLMLSEIIHAPEFAAPPPRWTPGAALALITLVAATRLMLPAENPVASHQPAGSAEGAYALTTAESSSVT